MSHPHYGNVDAGSTLYMWFSSFAATGASITTGGLAASDIVIYKDGSATQRSSTAGITVDDDFDSLTGIQKIAIDLSDNTDAGFYAAGSQYMVAVSDVTIDSQTVRFVLGTFRIGPPAVNVSQFGGTAGTFASGRPEVNVNSIATDAITGAAVAASAVTEIQSGLATAAALDAVDNFVDTEITAIQGLVTRILAGKLDQFTAITGTLSTTQATTSLSSLVTNGLVGRVVISLDTFQAARITANTSGGLLTFTAIAQAFVNLENLIIV